MALRLVFSLHITETVSENMSFDDKTPDNESPVIRANPKPSLTEGPVLRGVIALAWPTAAALFLEFALGITDFYWIGWLGSQQQDAITSSMIVVWTMFSLVSVVTIGVNAIVARNVGAQDFTRAGFVGSQGLKLSLLGGVLLAALGVVFSPDILHFMGADSEVAEFGVAYLRVFFLAVPALLFVETLGAIFRASGDTKRPMIVGLTGVGLNIILDPILIFGWLGAPELGIAGAAWGTFISLFVDVLIYLFFLRRNVLPFSLAGVIKGKFDIATCKLITKLGLPISVQHLVFVSVYSILIQIVHRFGFVAGAAMGIGNRLESINYLVVTAISIATSALVGQNLGAGKPERAMKVAWISTGLGAGFALFLSLFFIFLPDQLTSVFTDDPKVIEIARGYLIIVGLSQLFMGIEIVIDGAFSGAGDTVPPMMISIPGSLARIPLAYFFALTLDMGVSGVWLAISVTTVLKAGLLVYWFRRGGWRNKVVH